MPAAGVTQGCERNTVELNGDPVGGLYLPLGWSGTKLTGSVYPDGAIITPRTKANFVIKPRSSRGALKVSQYSSR